jgi:hypothetical protein
VNEESKFLTRPANSVHRRRTALSIPPPKTHTRKEYSRAWPERPRLEDETPVNTNINYESVHTMEREERE